MLTLIYTNAKTINTLPNSYLGQFVVSADYDDVTDPEYKFQYKFNGPEIETEILEYLEDPEGFIDNFREELKEEEQTLYLGYCDRDRITVHELISNFEEAGARHHGDRLHLVNLSITP